MEAKGNTNNIKTPNCVINELNNHMKEELTCITLDNSILTIYSKTKGKVFSNVIFCLVNLSPTEIQISNCVTALSI